MPFLIYLAPREQLLILYVTALIPHLLAFDALYLEKNLPHLIL